MKRPKKAPAGLLDRADLHRAEQMATGAAPFVVNAFYERLILLRATQPREWAAISPVSKLTLLSYEAAKRRAALLCAE